MPKDIPSYGKLSGPAHLGVVLLFTELAGCGSSNSPPVYSVSASVANLSGSGLTLQLNAGIKLVVPTPALLPGAEPSNTLVPGTAIATFAVPLPAGAHYTVTVAKQPSSPAQLCVVSKGSGTMGSADVTSVSVDCGFVVWTWVGGSSTGQTGVYGTRGIAAAGNIPGERGQAASWIDSSGNLWLFGGVGYDSTPPPCSDFGPCDLNDLWKYSPGTGLWTWVGGSNVGSSAGVYGTQGVASAANVPGARINAVTWADSSGNLWLFGGAGADVEGGGFAGGNRNDLWKYSLSTGLWTWVSGSNVPNPVGVYGAQGVAAAGNVPSPRGSAFSWTDTSGNLWMFGGSGNGILNDLWKYRPSTGLWTWVSGSNVPNAIGVYGTQGVAAAGNVPGSRVVGSPWNGITWTDLSGDLWLFGGTGYSSSTPPCAPGSGACGLNDLWKYSPSTGLWTWVGGSTETAFSNYGGGGPVTLGVATASTFPGAGEGAVSWTSPSGTLWMFAGQNLIIVYTGDMGNPYLISTGPNNDLWNYSPTSGLWTYFGGAGNDTPMSVPVYGTEGVGSPANLPNANGIYWADPSGTLWVFGGGGPYQYHGGGNVLWRGTVAQ
jgi:Galactose oxidase, central domain